MEECMLKPLVLKVAKKDILLGGPSSEDFNLFDWLTTAASSQLSARYPVESIY